jgi:hypothetical protein
VNKNSLRLQQDQGSHDKLATERTEKKRGRRVKQFRSTMAATVSIGKMAAQMAEALAIIIASVPSKSLGVLGGKRIRAMSAKGIISTICTTSFVGLVRQYTVVVSESSAMCLADRGCGQPP